MVNYNKERYEFIEQMMEKLDTVSVEAVVGQYVQLRRHGRHLMGYCPFHQSSHGKSFVVTPDKGIWKCFVCGEDYGGNAVNFISKYKGINYLDAAFDVAKDYGLISFDEYEKYSNQDYKESYVRQLSALQKIKRKKAIPQQAKANAQIMHNVYQCIKNASSLSEEHRLALTQERRLDEKRIAEDYFTFPINTKGKVIKAIQKQYPQYSDQVLATVPGFFINRETGKLSYAGYKGLGILIRDTNGFIQAIQIRKDTKKEGESRYTWFSSSFAAYQKEKFIGGCGCASPKDVLFPEGERNHILCITEGRFKSEILVKSGNTSISVQGVTSWKGIDKTIKACMDKLPYTKVHLFFDADIFGNHQLFVQSQKMMRYLQDLFPDLLFYYAVWHKADGKGIDDCINAGNISKVKFFTVGNITQVVDEIYDTITDAYLKRYNIRKIQEMPHEVAMVFAEELQKSCEHALLG